MARSTSVGGIKGSFPVGVDVDLHCHVLPGIDDGARDLADAVGMARQAEADGIAAICATPHIRHDHAVVISELPERRDQVSAAVRSAGCRTRILAGGEVAVAALDDLGNDALRAVALGGSGRWILLEPSPGPIDSRLEAAVVSLHTRGFRALVAHPERHLAPDLAGRLSELVELGALVQVTADALTNETTRAGMLELARGGVVHVLGSDAHSSRSGRRVELSGALETLRLVEPVSRHLPWVAHTAPQAIVEGRELNSPFECRPPYSAPPAARGAP